MAKKRNTTKQASKTVSFYRNHYDVKKQVEKVLHKISTVLNRWDKLKGAEKELLSTELERRIGLNSDPNRALLERKLKRLTYGMLTFDYIEPWRAKLASGGYTKSTSSSMLNEEDIANLDSGKGITTDRMFKIAYGTSKILVDRNGIEVNLETVSIAEVRKCAGLYHAKCEANRKKREAKKDAKEQQQKTNKSVVSQEVEPISDWTVEEVLDAMVEQKPSVAKEYEGLIDDQDAISELDALAKQTKDVPGHVKAYITRIKG